MNKHYRVVHKVSSWVECNLSEPLGDGCIERFYVGGMEIGVHGGGVQVPVECIQ